METTTLAARFLARRTNDTCPSWRAPMVGTSATVAFRLRRLSRVRRRAGTVRATMGFRDIGTQDGWVQGGVRPGLPVAREADLTKLSRPPPSCPPDATEMRR